MCPIIGPLGCILMQYGRRHHHLKRLVFPISGTYNTVFLGLAYISGNKNAFSKSPFFKESMESRLREKVLQKVQESKCFEMNFGRHLGFQNTCIK